MSDGRAGLIQTPASRDLCLLTSNTYKLTVLLRSLALGGRQAARGSTTWRASFAQSRARRRLALDALGGRRRELQREQGEGPAASQVEAEYRGVKTSDKPRIASATQVAARTPPALSNGEDAAAHDVDEQDE